MRMHPSSLTESLSRGIIGSLLVPGWSAFNALLYPELTVISMNGYCPLDRSSMKFSTIYTVLKHTQAIRGYHRSGRYSINILTCYPCEGQANT